MGQEIERKYLLNHALWQQLDKPKGERYRQGYILTDPQKTIRIRVTDLNVGAKRPEYEYEIPITEAEELLDKFAISELSKIRYKIPFKGKLWEVDQFLGDNEGLIVAEIELESEHEQYDIPEWISREVTGEEKYYNSNLTLHPYKNWR